jgi:hypothetical protein
MNLSD